DLRGGQVTDECRRRVIRRQVFIPRGRLRVFAGHDPLEPVPLRAPRWSTSPAGVQPDGTTDRCHASSSSPTTMESTASRWAARKASRAWSSAPSFRLLVMVILRVLVVVEQRDVFAPAA